MSASTATAGTTITITPTSGHGNTDLSIDSYYVSPTWNGSAWTFTMPANNVILTVTYNAQPQTYNITKTGNGASYVICDSSATAGTTITITPISGYSVNDLGVYADGDIGIAYYPTYWSFEMPAHNVTLTITYNEPSETYNITKTGNGVSYVTCPSSATAGTTITVTPTSGHGYNDLSVSSSSVSPTWNGSAWTFTMPASNVELTVTYNSDPEHLYTITMNENGANYTTLSPSSGLAVAGTNVYLDYNTSDHYITDTQPDVYEVESAHDMEFIMPASDVTIGIYKSYTITLSGSGASKIDMPDYGFPGQTIMIYPNTGYTTSDFYITYNDLTIVTTQNYWYFVMPTNAVELVVTYTGQ